MYDRALHKILVTLDGSEFSESVLDQIEEIAKANDTEVILLMVMPNPMGQIIDDVVISTVDQAAESAQLRADMYLQQVAERLSLRGITTSREVLFGDPAWEIAAYAKTHNIGLIAMASHQRRGLDRLLHGSVAHKVLTLVDQPVLFYTPRVAKAAKAA
jgi:nucleotide-binding universal stress UspA family protein